jgi:cyclic pyranopterin phosphate synthase
MSRLTHVDARGAASMVDVSAKPATAREAVAQARVILTPAAFQAVQDNAIAKGDVLAVARLAGIQGAKRTADLIPLCHPLPIASAAVDLALDEALPGVVITATVRTTGQTGVEMEALTAASVAALTVYDMTKAIDKGIRIEAVRLLRKSGGKSGTWVADEA